MRLSNRSFNVSLSKNERFARQSIENNRRSLKKEIQKEKVAQNAFQYLRLSPFVYTRRYMCHVFKAYV